MKTNLEESDPVFSGKRAPEADLHELMTWARERLGLGEDRPWRLISARTKLRKILFEVEEDGPAGPSRLVGKVSHSERSRKTYEWLSRVWQAGFQAPSSYRVTQPIAYLEERRLLLQSKAQGAQLLDRIREDDRDLPAMISRAAGWLAELHGTAIAADEFSGEPLIVERCAAELRSELPADAERIEQIAECLLLHFSRRSATDSVPSHGDYHPMNVFVAEDGCVTVIDFDTFSRRERASDVAYFLSQSAIMGYLERGSFERSRAVRSRFVDAYSKATGWRTDMRNVGLYMAFAFLQSLHFERSILHTGNSEIVEPWLRSAERCLDGDIHL